jgi:hypothetical protein
MAVAVCSVALDWAAEMAFSDTSMVESTARA